MTASETRQEARKSLTGKWGKAALATLVFIVLDYLITFILNFVPIFGYIANVIISLPISFGFTVCVMVKLKRGEDISYIEFFKDGFEKFAKIWQVTLWTFVKMLAPIAIAVIGVFIMVAGFTASAASSVLGGGSSAGIIFGIIGLIIYIAGMIWAIPRSFSYKLGLYIMNDNPDMLAKEAVEKSAELMKGHRWAYFFLQLSFIGWMILACLSLGIGMLWLIPYIQTTTVAFYDNLAGNQPTEPKTVESNSTNTETTNTDPIQEQ